MEQFCDKDFGNCRILFRGNEPLTHVCLFASHTFATSLPEYIYFYLEAIKKAKLSIIFISSSALNSADVKRLSGLASLIIEKENKGTDFGAWCAVLRWLDYGRNFTTLYLCNDSVFGPFCPLEDLHQKFYSRSEEVLGITDSHQGAGLHIQSYFVGLKQEVLKSKVWKTFWVEMELHNDKRKVIEYYEIGLTQKLLKAGFNCFIWTGWSQKIGFPEILRKVSQSPELRTRWLNRVLYEQQQVVLDINPSSFLWKELIEQCNNIFIKRELFIFRHLFIECEVENQWEPVLKNNTGYPLDLIRQFLVNYFFFKSVKSGIPEADGFNVFLPENLQTDEPAQKFFLFQALASLLQTIPVTVNTWNDPGLQVLKESGIAHLPVIISSTIPEKEIVCTFVYIDDSLATLDHVSLSKLKIALKRLSNLVIVVPDVGTQAIVASLLALRHDGIIIEREILFPVENCKLTSYFKHLLLGDSKANTSLFQRPTFADVVKDAIHSENNSAFVDSRKEESHALNNGYYDMNYYESRSDYLQYLNVKEKYHELYEKTPWWYKKLGQVIKIFQRNKKLIIQWKDKGLKDDYKPTTKDLLHWYYIQYEVLPGWYKDIGKSLVKRKIKHEKVSNL